MDNPIERIVAWNAKRYEQEYNAELTHSLLVEEYQEWASSDSDVINELKELCDIFFVATGASWKLGGFDNEELQEAEAFANSIGELVPSIWPGVVIGGLIDQHAMGMVPVPGYWLNCIANLAVLQMTCLGLNPEQCQAAILAVCDSNDTKTVKKTASDVKANIDKGPYYRPAEPALRKILEEAGCLSKTH